MQFLSNNMSLVEIRVLTERVIFSICVAFSTKDPILLGTVETCSRRGSGLKLLML